MTAFKRKDVRLLLAFGVLSLIVGGVLWRILGETSPKTNRLEDYGNIISSSSWEKLTNSSSLTDLEAKVAAPKITDDLVRVPFTMLAHDEAWKGDVYFNPKSYRSRYLRQDGLVVDFPFPGVPIDIQTVEEKGAAIAFRGIFDNKLWLLSVDNAGNLLSAQTIRRSGVDYPLFRAATAHDESLYWVIYDNNTRKNYLRSFKHGLGGWEQLAQDLELPSFEPPAGSTYEMEPPVSLHSNGSRMVEIIGGNWYGKASPHALLESSRLTECEAAIESVFTTMAPFLLCRASGNLTPQGGAYSIVSPSSKEVSYLDVNRGVPWNLHVDSEGLPAVDYASKAAELREVFIRDVSENHFGGMLEFGSNNTEGRVPWSQIYYLNGWMDAILLSRENTEAFELYGDILEDLRLRIELEVRLLDDLVASERALFTKAFTFDRSPVLFAVQTSRISLLFERYTTMFPDAPPLKSLANLRRQVPGLEGHIEVLAYEGEDPTWMSPGTAHLRWPKGSAFYFDGMPVPFNHQNEWASSIFEMKKGGVSINVESLDAARLIIDYFRHRLFRDGGFPSVDEWYYWYGHAYDGWQATEDRSIHTPEYAGDRGLAWISFRTIDLMSVMSAVDFLADIDKKALEETALDRIMEGDVYPFAARSVLEYEKHPIFKRSALYPYVRSEAPWALSNNVWALPIIFGFYKRMPSSQ